MDPHHYTVKSEVNARTTNTCVPLDLREGMRKVREEKESGGPIVLGKMGEKEKWRELEGKNERGRGGNGGWPTLGNGGRKKNFKEKKR